MFAKARDVSHVTAVLLALFVTFLWSTSWVIIKIGLQDIPPLTFAGLRYMLAFCCLLPVWAASRGKIPNPKFQIPNADRSGRWILGLGRWGLALRLVGLGFVGYAVTQGAQFVGLAYLPAVTLTLLLGMTPIVVSLLGLALLGERPSGQQWVGVGVALLGTLIYFYPVQIPAGQVIGLVVGLIGLAANSVSAVLGRGVNRGAALRPLTVTVVSMGVGATVLLAAGLLVQGLPELSLRHWAMIGWLAVVNTALAFTLWNMSLRTLTAMESSVINNTMSVQIPLLAVVFLGETISGRGLVGLAVTVVGTLLVQFGRRRGRGLGN